MTRIYWVYVHVQSNMLAEPLVAQHKLISARQQLQLRVFCTICFRGGWLWSQPIWEDLHTVYIFIQNNMLIPSQSKNTLVIMQIVTVLNSKDITWFFKISVPPHLYSSLYHPIHWWRLSPSTGRHTSAPSYSGRPLRWSENMPMNRPITPRLRDPAWAERLRPLQCLHCCHLDWGVSHRVQWTTGVNGCCRRCWRTAAHPQSDRRCAWDTISDCY